MQRVKLFIAESNFEEQNKLKEYFDNSDEFEVVGIADDGQKAIELAEKHNPDIMLCNFALKNADGITVTEKLKAGLDTKIIMFSSAFSDTCIKRMVQSGVDYYFLRPFEIDAVKKQILQMVGDAAEQAEKNAPKTKAARVVGGFMANRKVEERLSKIFITVGIPAHIKGYKFLREAVILTTEQPGIINCITKQLYPTVAKRFETTPSKVERAIRHAIEVGWSRGKIENLNELFNVKAFAKNDRPTNGEFIALIAEKMLIEGVS